MWRTVAACFALLVSAAVYAQNFNPWQPLAPAPANYNARTTGDDSLTLAVNFSDGDIVPESGPAGTFVRASSKTYADETGDTDLATVTAGNAAVEAFLYKQPTGTDGGVWISGQHKNWVLYSQDLSNAVWVATNVTKSTASMTRPDGTTASTDVVTASANNGEIMQDLGAPWNAASNTWKVSAFVKCASGTVAGKMRVRGSGGTPEESTTAFTAETTWKRITSDHKVFTGAATGTVNVGLSIDASGQAMHVWGLMAERVNDGSYGHSTRTHPGEYIPTTAAAAVTASDSLSFPSDVINPTAGTIMGFWNIKTVGGSGGSFASLFSVNGLDLSVYYTTAPIAAYGGSIKVMTASWGNDVWNHIAYTWEQNGANFDLKLYTNGVLSDSDAVAKAPISANPLFLGNWSSLPRNGAIEGLLSRLKVFNEALSQPDINGYYEADKGDYGL